MPIMRFALAGAVLLGAPGTARPDSFPASYWTTKTMSVPVSACVGAALKAVNKSGLSNVTSTDSAAGGNTATTRGYVICVRLPKAGDCNGDGSTAVIVTAGSDAKTLRDTMVKNFPNLVTFDCSP
jgi:hypothetical protein